MLPIPLAGLGLLLVAEKSPPIPEVMNPELPLEPELTVDGVNELVLADFALLTELELL